MTHREILQRLPQLRALVLGDICLDRWCTYDPRLSEPSRETGIPRTAVIATETTAGAAGTVANNLADLGVGEVAVMGVIGADGFGFELKQALARRNISTEWVLEAPGRPTFTYTKLINASTNEEDLPRVDFIPAGPAPAPVESALMNDLQACVRHFDAIYIADQAETENGGLISPRLRELLEVLARQHPEKIFFVDSRVRIDQFRHMILKPNESEAEGVCQRRFGDGRAYAQLRQHTQAPLLLVTHGGSGVTWVDDVQEHFLVTERVARPVDICGAGDSFSAGCGMALAAGATPAEAAYFGHAVASVTVMKKGTGTATPAEVLAVPSAPVAAKRSGSNTKRTAADAKLLAASAKRSATNVKPPAAAARSAVVAKRPATSTKRSPAPGQTPKAVTAGSGVAGQRKAVPAKQRAGKRAKRRG